MKTCSLNFDKRNKWFIYWKQNLKICKFAISILQNLWKCAFNIASSLKNLKALIKQIYDKGCTEKFYTENDPAMYFISGLQKSLENQINLKKGVFWILIKTNRLFIMKFMFNKSNFFNTRRN